ncbi:nicotinic acid mononucleotide adenyltransferase [Zeaxanthinibacter sp. PT1]|uniref:nicotinic acid mononucleotide adenyltransferase n=1 Tax=Zeaxanthinibacter TaxID=561554 RepID=UPI00234B2833|nr:nicotinic acid mononucleotide adenyltransferase [Zeaxanthinibacter sp. PT1]MDC6350884.1 nicotinic acid mononucleotide adenyltransferase [Zeaxanthinibacter sp. PT1]
MKPIQLLAMILLVGIATSCTREVLVQDSYIETSALNTREVLESFDLWYVDITATQGNGSVPFLDRAFTVSFDRGVLLANNNLVGIGKTGGGLGIDVGSYATLRGIVEVAHDLDGNWLLEVFAVNGNTIELYSAATDTSYFLKGYQRAAFDYDGLFLDNIRYFLQEYEAWEKVYTSEEGALNEFDEENYLQFNAQGDFFRSSVDGPGRAPSEIVWDYEGDYGVFNIAGDRGLKTLTLDYDYMGEDYFELYVINDQAIELYHPESGTIYEFRGRGYLQYLKGGTEMKSKVRSREKLPLMNVERKRPSKE